MDVLKRTDLRELVEQDGKWHVSIYMPTQRAGRNQQQNPIRLKNLMAEAEKKLLEYDVRKPDIQEMLRPAEELLTDRDFWQHQGRAWQCSCLMGIPKFIVFPRVSMKRLWF